MKRNYIAVTLGLMMVLSPLSAYAEEQTTESQTTIEAGAAAGDNQVPSGEMNENMLMGEVTEVGENFIVIKEMTMGMGSEDESSTETEETQVISVTEDTVLQKSAGMGGGMGQMGGEAPDGEAPADAGGEAPSDVGAQAPSDAGAQAPDGEASADAGGEAPSDAGAQVPDGEAPSDAGAQAPDGEAPSDAGTQAPDGEAPAEMGAGGQMGGGQTETITLSDIEAGDTVMVTLADDGSAASITVRDQDMAGGMGQGGDMGQPGGGSQGVDSYDAVETIEEDTTLDGETVASTGTDENAILVSGDAEAVLSNLEVTRDSDDSTGGDNSSFYGVGAAVLGTAGTTYISDSTVTTDSAGGAGIFAYGDGVVYVDNCEISTAQGTSGGIHVAGGGTLYAWDTTAVTGGTSSAAVRSDRGSGTMVVDGGSYTSNGADSPAVYCTADISIHDAELASTASEAVCIEGLNTLRLYDCNLSGNLSDDTRNDSTWTVIVYQSMSGDSEVGNGTFQMQGGTLTSGNGGIFYTTNTECTFFLQDVDITYADDCEYFLQCTGNANSRGWGQTGSNGSDCNFTASSQEMQGDVIWDSISNLDFYMTEGSTLTGAILNDETNAGSGGDGVCNVIIDGDSEWIVTGDSTVSSLLVSGRISDTSGKTVTVIGTDGTVYVEGDSEYTITTGSYSDEAEVSGAATGDSWEDHAVEKAEA